MIYERICGMARWSKRSFAAVGTFMSTGILSASICSPKCKLITFLYATAESIDSFYPNKWSTYYASLLLIAMFAVVTIISRILSKEELDTFQEEETITLLVSSKQESGTFQESLSNDIYSKGPITAIAATFFSAGLFISGMTKTYKIQGFLDLKLIPKGCWDPTLLFVMGSGFLFSMLSYHYVQEHNLFKNDKVISCPLLQDHGKFNIPTSQTIDRQLIVGGAIFGVGWGLGGLCPGPALFLAANGYPPILFFWWPCYMIGAVLGEHTKAYI